MQTKCYIPLRIVYSYSTRLILEWPVCRCVSLLLLLPPLRVWSLRVQTMSALGAEVTEVSLPSLPQQCAAYYVNALSEASANLARFDGIRYG